MTDEGRTRGAVACLVGAWALSVVTQGFVIVPASVLGDLSASLGVAEATAVWVVSATPAAWAASNFAAGRYIDEWGDVTATVVATAVFVVACAWCWRAGRAGDFFALLAARALAGVGIGVVWTASANLVGRAFPTGTRGSALGVYTTSAPMGFALGQAATPAAADAVSWPAVFLGVGLLSLPVLGVFLVGARTAENGADDDATPAADAESTWSVLRHRGVLAGCALAFAAYSLYLFLNSWLPTYLTGRVGVSAATAGVLAAAFPATGVVSRAAGGVVSDRLFDGARMPVLRLSFLAATPVVVAIGLTSRVGGLVVLVVAAGFVVQLTFGVVYSYVRERVPDASAGRALSFLGTAGISGAFTAPLVAGALIGETGSYTAAFAYAGVLGLAGVALSWVAPEPT